MSDSYKAFHHTTPRISSVLSGPGSKYSPVGSLVIKEPGSRLYETMSIPWNTKEYMLVHKAIPLKQIEASEEEAFSAPQKYGLHIYNMPLKLAGDMTCYIPVELEPFRKTIEYIINYQYTIKSEKIIDDYAYISVDQSWVEPNDSQRKPGAHSDDLQGPRYPKKIPPNQTYIISNLLPTKTYPQPFDFGEFSPDEYDLLPLIQKQASENEVFELPLFTICLYDSYTIHSANINTSNEKVWRTLLRLEFTQKIGDEITNTRNPLLIEATSDWVYQPREKPSLKAPF